MSVLTKTTRPDSRAVKAFSRERFSILGRGKLRDLKVTYFSGRTYLYKAVPRELIAELEEEARSGGSVGAFVRYFIRDHFDCVEIST
jgi:KTSC domain